MLYEPVCLHYLAAHVKTLSCLGESEVGRVSGCAHFIHHHCGSQPRTFSLQIAMLGNFSHKELIRFLQNGIIKAIQHRPAEMYFM